MGGLLVMQPASEGGAVLYAHHNGKPGDYANIAIVRKAVELLPIPKDDDPSSL